MKTRKPGPRILSVQLRLRRFGYAVFEGPDRLLDWGVYFFPSAAEGGGGVARSRIGDLMRLFTPSVVVVKKATGRSGRSSPALNPILRAMRRESSARSIPVCLVGPKDLREVFGFFQSNNKYETAVVLSQIFPDLLWKLPPKRNIYDTEHPRMIVFDAVAAGFAYWHSDDTRFPPPE